ncbi:MAG: alpha/beta hydrolase [Clostridia bacterium]|nr:alpha/beta hydrolase [Clostridia bacterium]
MSGDPRLNAEGLALSDRYAETMREVVLPRIDSCRTDLVVPGDGGRPLFVSRFDASAPRGTVMLLHGFTENIEKYAELIHSLLECGMSVVAYDQRGHGRSWRDPALADASLTHVDAFDAYVRDMSVVCAQMLPGMPMPHRVFCHSMGGAVTALFLESHPGFFDRAAMCAPMIAPDLHGMPKPSARLMCRAAIALGRGRQRIFTSKPYTWPDDFDTSCATGRARFDWYEAQRREEPLFTNNGPSYGWTLESIDVTDRILAPGAVERIDAKVRLYTAALDATVLPVPQKMFIDRVPDGSHVTVRGAKHEIYRSADEVLFPWWRDVLAFLSVRAPQTR